MIAIETQGGFMFGNSSKARYARIRSKAWLKYDVGDEVYDAYQ